MKETLVIGKVIKMACMRRGLCAYANETVLVSQETLERISGSIMGVPLVIDHPDDLINDDNIKTLDVVGRVADMHYEAEDDFWYAHFVVDDQRGVDLLNQGYGISTAWFGEKYASGGTLNNVGYDRELLEGRYEHLAIVKTPRYEMAVNPIFLNSKPCQKDASDSNINMNNIILNTKEQKGSSMIGKIFKKLVSREEIKTNEGEEIYVNVDGTDMPISHMISELKLNKKNAEEKKEEEKKMANGADEVDVDGEKISVNELVKRYKAGCKKNEVETKEEEKKEGKKNAADEEEEKKESKKNSLDETEKNFKMVKSLHENGITYELEDQFLSTRERVQLGKDRYGKRK
jgi:hypothetical protein